MTEHITIFLDRDDFEQRIGGGIPKSSIMIIEGKDGCGKSIISQRITYGALMNNYTVTYISTEMSILDFIRQMDSLNYPIRDFLLTDKLMFISLTSLFGRTKFEENLILELMKSKSKKLFEKDIIIIDSLSYPLVNSIPRMSFIKFLDFLQKIKSKDKIIILTYNPFTLSRHIVEDLRNIADIYFKADISSSTGQLTRYIEIKRFRNAKQQYELIIPFRVEPGLGLIVEIVTIV
ncbi:AAA family ATPase [Nanoarchaeota archaeon NZ13-N]|nr:MAG: AAA family ATPase [Nanoarchaeota archaeon NZ13-N]